MSELLGDAKMYSSPSLCLQHRCIASCRNPRIQQGIVGRMPPRGPIKAAFFVAQHQDLDDTLLLTTEADAAALQDVAALLAETRPQVDVTDAVMPVSWEEVHAAWKAAFKDAPWDKEHKVPVEEWRGRLWQRALDSSGATDAGLGARLQAYFTQRRTARFTWEPRVQEVVGEVQKRGLQAVIITNGHPEIQRGKLAACRAAEAVAHVIIGGDEVAAGRAEKPAASIFLKACQLAGCQPHEAVHIGDSLAADIQGGINAGLGATVWVNAKGMPLPSGAPQPTYTVQHVTELLRVLDELAQIAGDKR